MGEEFLTERICALEITKEGFAEIFRRDSAGNVTCSRREDFKPFFLASFDPFKGNAVPEGVCVRTLAGEGFYKFDCSFSNIDLYETALKELKKITGKSASFTGSPYKVFSDLPQQYLIRNDLRLFKGMTFPEVRRMQFDIETLCSEGYDFPNAARKEDAVIIISLRDSTGWEKVLSLDQFPSEKELLEAFCKEVTERDPDILEGHNIFRFDLPYLETRAKLHKVKLALGRNGSTPAKRNSRFSVAERVVNYTRYDIYGRHLVDTYILLTFYDAIHRNLDSYSLKYAAKHFGVASPERTYINGNEITDSWHTRREDLLKYALDDVRECDALSRILSPSWFYQTGIVPFTYQNCIVRGNATRIDALFAAEYIKAETALPCGEYAKPFSGALTQAFEAGVFDSVDHCDVRSLYPSVILSENWSPSRDTLGVFSRFLAQLRSFRLNAKDQAKNAATQEEKDYYNALQSAFKILINSFYGYLGFEQGFLNDYDMAQRVTARGREILMTMVETLQASSAKIIEMDTDGIYFQLPAGGTLAQISSALEQKLPSGISVDFDESYKGMFCYKSKNYALLRANGELAIAGAALKSRGLEPFQRKYMEKLIRALLEHDAKKAASVHEEFVQLIQNHALPFAELAKSETLNDSPETYKRKLESGSGKRSAAYELVLRSQNPYRQGDQVSFYITGDKKRVSVVDNCKLLSEAEESFRDENVPYYLEKLEELRKKFAAFLPEIKEDVREDLSGHDDLFNL